jgi:hypothetical protein
VPLTPVIVSRYEPRAVVASIVTFKVEEAVAGFGVNDAVTPAGAPLRLNATFPLNPFEGVIVTA